VLRDAPNLQALWGDLIVEELIRNNVVDFVVCPGSRSTPLVQAIVRNPEAKATLWIDERGAAYHALGMGRNGWAHAVVTTSGTAVANLLPAVVEASIDGVPLILLTADRPPELREVGANQSVRQAGIFGDHVRWACDLPAPDVSVPAHALLSAVDHAVHRAVDGHPGPVHLNVPLREPLAPTSEAWPAVWLEPLATWLDGKEPWTGILTGDLVDTLHDEDLARRVRTAERGLLVCGAMGHADGEAVISLARRLGWPLWADVRSGLRLGKHVPGRCAHLDRILAADGLARPDLVLQFGGRITSKRMLRFLEGGFATYALVDPEPRRLDPSHQVTHRYASDIEAVCQILEEHLEDQPGPPAPSLPRHLDDRVEAAIAAAVEEDDDALSEPFVARWLSRRIDPGHMLFLSSSMPIRDMQSFAVPDGPAVAVAANRGASGIDGVVSTAAGFAQGGASPTTLLIGDLALLHDVNALAMLKGLAYPLTIVVLNNGGGSIFSFLPVAQHEDVRTPWIDTPHAITFDGVCASFDVPHAHVADRAAFKQAYRDAIRSGTSWVIEVDSSLSGNKAHHDRIEAAIAAALRERATP